ncbi:trypsin-7-like [Chelonus insularis]|uniref:trypsin-7-like n=1 Tax=Chelonus insularis TaxID=460826 RepID=UPI00158ABB4F|nr:trypsin-7-like [Chelonus insularis]
MRFAIGSIESTRLPNYSQLKIIGGIIIPIRWRPFMVSLHSESEFICGGTILSSVWILTAYHCIDPDFYTTRYYVRAGSSYHDHGGSVHAVLGRKMYNPQLHKYGIPIHDIILLRINPPLEFSFKIKPAKLPDSDFIPSWLWVSGWGATETKSTSDLLRTVRIRYIPYEICINSAPSYEVLLNRNYHVCYGDPGYDSCYGDSGGPLSGTTVIYGIVSFGNRCAIDPGVYARVFYYKDWIKEVTGQSNFLKMPLRSVINKRP